MRNFKIIILLIVLPIIISSCGFNAWKGTIPTGFSGEWIKEGISRLEIDKAKLECGYTHLASKLVPNESENDYFFSFRCMEKSGFSYFDNEYDLCEFSPQQQWICNLPLSKIPDRDINKRLNSLYCKNMRLTLLNVSHN